MAIITGGVLGERGEAGRALSAVMQTISAFAPGASEDEYAVDLAFFSWSPSLGPTPPGASTAPGVCPQLVGRQQRRFIIQLAIPYGLADQQALLSWLVPSLLEAARLCREYLPRKSRRYPAESLAQEVEELARHLESAYPKRSAGA